MHFQYPLWPMDMQLSLSTEYDTLRSQCKLDIFENSMRGLPTLPSVGYHSKRCMLNGQPDSQRANQPNLKLNFVLTYNLTSLSLSLAYYIIEICFSTQHVCPIPDRSPLNCDYCTTAVPNLSLLVAPFCHENDTPNPPLIGPPVTQFSFLLLFASSSGLSSAHSVICVDARNCEL